MLAVLSPVAGPGDALSEPLGRHQVVGALRRLLVASADGSDLLIQIDDAHLADDADADVMLQLISAGAPLCLLVVMRLPAAGSALARGLARLRSAGTLQVQEVGPLNEDECRRLVLRATPKRLDDPLVHRVMEAAEGNPFAAIELARSAASTGDGRLPASVADAVLDRLCDVPADALGLLRWLALSGDGVDIATVEALAGAAQALPAVALDACLQAVVLCLLAAAIASDTTSCDRR